MAERERKFRRAGARKNPEAERAELLVAQLVDQSTYLLTETPLSGDGPPQKLLDGGKSMADLAKLKAMPVPSDVLKEAQANSDRAVVKVKDIQTGPTEPNRCAIHVVLPREEGSEETAYSLTMIVPPLVARSWESAMRGNPEIMTNFITALSRKNRARMQEGASQALSALAKKEVYEPKEQVPYLERQKKPDPTPAELLASYGALDPALAEAEVPHKPEITRDPRDEYIDKLTQPKTDMTSADTRHQLAALQKFATYAGDDEIYVGNPDEVVETIVAIATTAVYGDPDAFEHEDDPEQVTSAEFAEVFNELTNEELARVIRAVRTAAEDEAVAEDPTASRPLELAEGYLRGILRERPKIKEAAGVAVPDRATQQTLVARPIHDSQPTFEEISEGLKLPEGAKFIKKGDVHIIITPVKGLLADQFQVPVYDAIVIQGDLTRQGLDGVLYQERAVDDGSGEKEIRLVPIKSFADEKGPTVYTIGPDGQTNLEFQSVALERVKDPAVEEDLPAGVKLVRFEDMPNPLGLAVSMNLNPGRQQADKPGGDLQFNALDIQPVLAKTSPKRFTVADLEQWRIAVADLGLYDAEKWDIIPDSPEFPDHDERHKFVEPDPLRSLLAEVGHVTVGHLKYLMDKDYRGRIGRMTLRDEVKLRVPITGEENRFHYGEARGFLTAAEAGEHTIILGPPGSGKSQLLKFNILIHPGSVISTATDREMYRDTKEWTGSHGKVYRFDPYNVSREGTHTWNPLQHCRTWTDALEFAHDLIVGSEGSQSAPNGDNDYWYQQAESLLAPLLYVMANAEGGSMAAVNAAVKDYNNPDPKSAINLAIDYLEWREKILMIYIAREAAKERAFNVGRSKEGMDYDKVLDWHRELEDVTLAYDKLGWIQTNQEQGVGGDNTNSSQTFAENAMKPWDHFEIREATRGNDINMEELWANDDPKENPSIYMMAPTGKQDLVKGVFSAFVAAQYRAIVNNNTRRRYAQEDFDAAQTQRLTEIKAMPKGEERDRAMHEWKSRKRPPRKPKTFLPIDEAGNIVAFPKLDRAMSLARKEDAFFALGFQTGSQIMNVYGEDALGILEGTARGGTFVLSKSSDTAYAERLNKGFGRTARMEKRKSIARTKATNTVAVTKADAGSETVTKNPGSTTVTTSEDRVEYDIVAIPHITQLKDWTGLLVRGGKQLLVKLVNPETHPTTRGRYGPAPADIVRKAPPTIEVDREPEEDPRKIQAKAIIGTLQLPELGTGKSDGIKELGAGASPEMIPAPPAVGRRRTIYERQEERRERQASAAQQAQQALEAGQDLPTQLGGPAKNK